MAIRFFFFLAYTPDQTAWILTDALPLFPASDDATSRITITTDTRSPRQWPSKRNDASGQHHFRHRRDTNANRPRMTTAWHSLEATNKSKPDGMAIAPAHQVRMLSLTRSHPPAPAPRQLSAQSKPTRRPLPGLPMQPTTARGPLLSGWTPAKCKSHSSATYHAIRLDAATLPLTLSTHDLPTPFRSVLLPSAAYSDACHPLPNCSLRPAPTAPAPTAKSHCPRQSVPFGSRITPTTPTTRSQVWTVIDRAPPLHHPSLSAHPPFFMIFASSQQPKGLFPSSNTPPSLSNHTLAL